jgi:hypothetical protein
VYSGDVIVPGRELLAQSADQLADDDAAHDLPGLLLQVGLGEQGVPVPQDLQEGAVDGLLRPVVRAQDEQGVLVERFLVGEVAGLELQGERERGLGHGVAAVWRVSGGCDPLQHGR